MEFPVKDGVYECHKCLLISNYLPNNLLMAPEKARFFEIVRSRIWSIVKNWFCRNNSQFSAGPRRRGEEGGGERNEIL